ncbi:hypothetical protein [Salinicoccus roseus]|uniref:hypothetical protein n=1 Tax=Salinicoccus roseus TaxID=45670 RepID=UPI00356A622E
MKKGIIVLMILVLVACSNEAVSNGPDMGEGETLAKNLETPWMIEKTEEGFYISERGGVLKLVSDGEVTAQSLELDRETNASGEGGAARIHRASERHRDRLSLSYIFGWW